MAHTADVVCNTETVAISIQENVGLWDAVTFEAGGMGEL